MECMSCSHKRIYKYNLCESCFSNLRLDIIWDRELQYVDRVVIGGAYYGKLKEIIRDYKFHDKVYYVDVLSEILTEKLFLGKLHREYSYISYVPMHKRDFKERGYNQSKLLAEKIASESLLKFVEPIEKVRRTKKQVEILASDRYQNLKDAFEVIEDIEVPQNLIIVDDVMTTGSTIEEIAKVLKEKGTKKVAALVCATHSF